MKLKRSVVKIIQKGAYPIRAYLILRGGVGDSGAAVVVVLSHCSLPGWSQVFLFHYFFNRGTAVPPVACCSPGRRTVWVVGIAWAVIHSRCSHWAWGDHGGSSHWAVIHSRCSNWAGMDDSWWSYWTAVCCFVSNRAVISSGCSDLWSVCWSVVTVGRSVATVVAVWSVTAVVRRGTRTIVARHRIS